MDLIQPHDNFKQQMEPLFSRLRTKSNAAAFERQAKGSCWEHNALEQDRVIREHGSTDG